MFGSLFFNGVVSIVFCLRYRQPLVFFWTIPGTVLVGPALGHLPFAEVVGAYIATGVLMSALGAFGLVRRAMAAVPMPIVMGMVAGVFLQFGLDWVRAFQARHGDGRRHDGASSCWSVRVPALAARLPPLLVALIAGAAVIWHAGVHSRRGWSRPDCSPRRTLQVPQFSWAAMVELVVPLAITVLVVQNGQGIAVLRAAGHAPPVDSHRGRLRCLLHGVAPLVGAVPTCLTGPVNAIISAGGERRTQYTAGVVVGVLAMAFGLIAPLVTRLMLSTPPAFIAALAGLAMLQACCRAAFTVAFQGGFTLGALVTFLVTVAGIPIFNIGAPFWALIAGTAVSLLLERGDWRASAETQAAERG